MRLVIMCLIAALLGLQYKLWVGDSSLPRWLQLKHQLEIQEEDNQQDKSRNQAISADILELKSGNQALEEQARYELGMVKEGETYYQLVE